MKLNIAERLIIVNSLPEKGTFVNLKIIEDIKSKMHPSEEEVKLFEIKQTETSITWNEKGIEKKEIDLTEQQVNFIKERLENVGNSGEATMQQYAVYKLFSEDK